MDRPEQRRHRAGRARLRLPDAGLRDQLRAAAGELRRARAVGVRSEPGAARTQLTYNVGVTHELLRGTSVSAEWFHSDFKNLIARNNVARSASDYTPVNVASPIDGSPITYYNVSAAKLAAVQNVDSNDPNLKRSYNSVELNFNTRLPGGARLFGGTSIERIITNSCSAAANDPNLLLFCDGSKNNIPWLTSFKLAGTYPLPWYGITVSGALQALAGMPIGHGAAAIRRLHRGHRLRQPNGIGTFYLVSAATVYPANCKGAPARPGALVIPGLTPASRQPGLIAPGTEFTPRINQVDFGLSKTFTFDTIAVHAEARSLQRAELGRLLVGGRQHAVRRGHLHAAVGRAAGPHHPRRHRRQVVVRSGLEFRIENWRAFLRGARLFRFRTPRVPHSDTRSRVSLRGFL